MGVVGALTTADAATLVCPECRGELQFAGAAPNDRLAAGELRCATCQGNWAVRDSLPRLYRDDWVKGPDRLMRRIYDSAPRLHDPAVRYGLPVMQLGGREDSMRMRYVKRMELAGTDSGGEDRPLRVLEVSVGAGASVAMILAHLPVGRAVEYWGLDLSVGMVGVCQRRLQRSGEERVRLLLGDAHRLPFRDGWFDRVFHVGGIGGFSNPAAALAEMARVARPDTPIVVVDEQLEEGARFNLWKRAWFAAVTFYDDNPHCPVEALPAGAEGVVEEQISAFYYCLTFRMPAAGGDA